MAPDFKNNLVNLYTDSVLVLGKSKRTGIALGLPALEAI